ncbi:glycosyltransferase family 9 protein [Haematospirillum sp. H1815]|uniref:glycosyltransferase family 9 protein n=1 Tax=Haematospirillum sp. H1815 TaxID=2723108 RepID=UPI00143BFCF0|nr:glycosyltransferase family 9 protein [Haematospirillum sp. H1815]NKD77236.1 glycosyltransferase family 9 protein [Haematospirillum sp. H1815]
MTRVLIARVGGIGDSLALLPVLLALKKDRPDLDITVLLSPIGATVLNPVLGCVRVVTVPRAFLSGVAGLRCVPELVKQVGRQDKALLSYDETAAVHGVAACVSPCRIGFSSGISRGECLLTHRLPFDPHRPVYDMLYDLARFMGGVCPVMRSARLPGRVEGTTAYGELHVRAATSLQEWDVMHRLAPYLEAATGFPWLVRRGVEDGRSLGDFLSGIAGARAVVSVHSGPLHLAAALGVPVVGIAGPTARTWDPPGVPVLRLGPECQPCGLPGAPARVCWRGDHACLSQLVPRMIMKSLLPVLHAQLQDTVLPCVF